MNKSKKYNPPREFFLETLNWLDNLDSINQDISLETKKEENKIYREEDNTIGYNGMLFRLIENKLVSLSEKLPPETIREICKKLSTNVLIFLGSFKKNDLEEKAYIKLSKNIVNEEETAFKYYNITTYINTISISLSNVFRYIDVRSPVSLKEISSEALFKDALVFGKFTESIEKNERHIDTVKELFEGVRNIPSPFKELLKSKTKEALEKESTTRDL